MTLLNMCVEKGRCEVEGARSRFCPTDAPPFPRSWPRLGSDHVMAYGLWHGGADP